MQWTPELVDAPYLDHAAPGGKHPMIFYRVSTIFLVVQDFATIHSRWAMDRILGLVEVAVEFTQIS